MKDTNCISVYVANLGKYNEGFLVGKWISLPVSDSELSRFLKEEIGIGGLYEEYAIHDFEEIGYLEALDFKPSEYESLEDLNLLACLCRNLEIEGGNLESIKLAMRAIDQDFSALEIANLVLQWENIPAFPYSFIGIENCQNDSNYELLGRTFAEVNGTYKKLVETDTESYFNFEKYGTDLALINNLYLGDEYYLFANGISPNTVDIYTAKEIKANLVGYLAA